MYPAMEMLTDLGIKPKVAVETNNQESQKRIVLQGTGFTVVPKHMVEHEVQTGDLYRVATPKKIGLPVLMVQRKNQELSKPALVFRKMVAGRFTK
jgi:DNA-binding transcriptional LysR family regulator